MEISIANEIQRFGNFLNEKDNNNIIFSGIFGIGKSYFLRKFFTENYSDNYISIYLTPVNYSVANNEDIFEYMKIDILMQLLDKVPCDFDKGKISFSVGAYFYIKNHLKDFLVSLFTVAEKVKAGTDITQRLIDLKTNIEQFISENTIDEKRDVDIFFKEISSEKGSIYENGIITQIIRSLVANAKIDNDAKKQIVLIIDDLDRIDPEHIFRILNILSAHNDFCGTAEHKFGFDKTILVCDIDNIRYIYSAKYGINVDFNGYIDKFYSKEIYHFNNEESIIENISKLLCSIKTSGENLIGDKAYPSFNACFSIITALVKCNKLNLRTLLKYNLKYINTQRSIQLNNTECASNIPCIVIFDFISSMYLSIKETENSIFALKHSHFNKNLNRNILETFIILADYNHNNLSEGEHTYQGIKYNIGINDKFSLLTLIDQKKTAHLDINIVIKDAFLNYRQYFSKH